jgi:hypothetical protein
VKNWGLVCCIAVILQEARKTEVLETENKKLKAEVEMLRERMSNLDTALLVRLCVAMLLIVWLMHAARAPHAVYSHCVCRCCCDCGLYGHVLLLLAVPACYTTS